MISNDDKPIKKFLLSNLNIILLIVSSLFVLFQFSFFTYSITKNVDNWSIIYSFDNDAANAIRTAQRSTWINNNEYYNYGNLYFRIVHTIQKFNPLTGINESNLFSQTSDESFHFSLMLISLISMFLISFLLASVISKNNAQRLFLVFIFNIIFFGNYEWVSKIFGAHPDLLLCFFTSISIYFSIKFLISEKKDTFFYLSSVFWGITLATKLFTVFYLPVLILLFIPKFSKENILKAIKFYLIISAIYFIVGFPQNLEIINTLGFIKYQSGYSIAPTIDSFIEWWNLLFHQSIFSIVTIFLIVFFLDKDNFNFKSMDILKVFIIAFFPFTMLLSRNVTSPHTHYTLPVVAGLLIYFSFVFKKIRNFIPEQKSFFTSDFKTIFLLLISCGFFIFTPNAIPSVLGTQLKCRDEARSLYKIVTEYQSKDLIIHVDPYIPFSPYFGKVVSSWFRTFDDIKPGNAHVLVFSRNFYSRYISGDEASHYIKQDTDNWKEIRKFYLNFYNKSSTSDPYNQKWIKIYTDNCGREIWILESLAKK